MAMYNVLCTERALLEASPTWLLLLQLSPLMLLVRPLIGTNPAHLPHTRYKYKPPPMKYKIDRIQNTKTIIILKIAMVKNLLWRCSLLSTEVFDFVTQAWLLPKISCLPLLQNLCLTKARHSGWAATQYIPMAVVVATLWFGLTILLAAEVAKELIWTHANVDRSNRSSHSHCYYHRHGHKPIVVAAAVVVVGYCYYH